MRIVFLFLAVALCMPVRLALASADGVPATHYDILPLLLALTVILFTAKLGGNFMARLELPEVLGELFVGILLGNLVHLGFSSLEYLKTDPGISALSELGVILLMFEVGLHSTLSELTAVGRTSTLVAVVGVIAPMLLGIAVGRLFIPEEPLLAQIFLGAVLTATSVGITARVLKDLNKLELNESKIILGAAVIDDVLGLLVLAVIGGAIQAAGNGEELNLPAVGRIFIVCFAFFAAAVLLGRGLSRSIFHGASLLKVRGVLLPASLVFCFLFAFVAAKAGLAPIVGAFVAGLLLEPSHYQKLIVEEQDSGLEELITPLAAFTVPIFFVHIGLKVNLLDFLRADILVFAAVLTAAAVVGKQICSLVVTDRKLDRVLVGFGMIPRGEVGLIFAGVGSTLVLNGLPVINSATYGAIVVMVIVTTIITPFLLKLRLDRSVPSRRTH